jgi:hypothetical protein
MEKVTYWEMCFKRHSLSPQTPCPAIPGHHEVSSFSPATPFHRDVLPCYRPKSSRAKQPQTETSATMSQKKSFFLKLFISGILSQRQKKMAKKQTLSSAFSIYT